MLADFWTEAGRMTTSGLLVAMGAVPVGLLAWAARPLGEPLPPRWKPWRVPWSGFEVVVAFLVVSFVLPVTALEILTHNGFYQAVYGADFPMPKAQDVPPERLKEAATLRQLWAQLLALPVALGLLWGAARALYPTRNISLVGTGSTAGKVWLAVAAWLVLAPAVLVFHSAVNEIAQQFNVTPDTHSLTKLGGRPLLDQVLFVFEACGAAPLREELFFRGILLAWCVGRIRIPGAGVTPVTGARPVFVMGAAVLFAALEKHSGPVIFAAVLVVGFGAVWQFVRTGARRARAVYATAALFAMIHSAVWPSPIPLFVLGLGLGWLAVRTNGVLVPVIVHGLFNAISVTFVLRSAG